MTCVTCAKKCAVAMGANVLKRCDVVGFGTDINLEVLHVGGRSILRITAMSASNGQIISARLRNLGTKQGQFYLKVCQFLAMKKVFWESLAKAFRIIYYQSLLDF